MSTEKSTAKADLKNDLKDFKRDLRVLRDEVRLKVHLAGMDLKQEWETFEPARAGDQRGRGGRGRGRG